MRSMYSATRTCTSCETLSALEPHASSTMNRDVHDRVGAGDLGRLARQARDSLHLERRITRVPSKDVVRDERRLHHADRTTSSVTSGRAKRRNGTNVVPRPGETCSQVVPYS